MKDGDAGTEHRIKECKGGNRRVKPKGGYTSMAGTDRHKLHPSSEACNHVVECTHTKGGRNSERRVNGGANISNIVHTGENRVKHTQAGTRAFQR